MLPARLCSSFLHIMNDSSEMSHCWNAVTLNMFLHGPDGLAGGDHTQQPVVVVWINRVASEIVISSYIPKSHPGFPQRNVTVGIGTPWTLLVDVVSKFLLEVITVADILENTVQPGVGLCINRVAGEIAPSLCIEELTRGDPSLQNAGSLLLRVGSVVSTRLSSPWRTCCLGVSVPCFFHFYAALIVAIMPRARSGVLCTSPRREHGCPFGSEASPLTLGPCTRWDHFFQFHA